MSSSVKAKLISRGLKPKKSFGQNFMIDQNINHILAEAVLSLGSHSCLEIGAGTGSLTNHLLKVCPLLYAVERDRDLIPMLAEEFKDDILNHKLILLEDSIKNLNLSSYFSIINKGILVGNLPYHLTSSILLLAITYKNILHGCIFLIQKEVADRLLAKPHSKDYNFLTVILQLVFSLSRVHQVSKHAFWPIPKVDATIIKLIPKPSILKDDEITGMITWVRSLFQKRRKQLGTILSAKLSAADFMSININPHDRPENLTGDQFITLYRFIENKYA